MNALFQSVVPSSLFTSQRSRHCFSLLALLLWSLTNLSAQPITNWESFQEVKQLNDVATTNGTHYVATDAGIFLIDAATNQLTDHWTRVTADLPSNRIEAITLEPQTGQLIIGTYDMGVFRTTPDNDGWIPVSFPEEANVGDRLPLTYCLETGDNGDLYVGTDNGLWVKSGDDWTRTVPEGVNSSLDEFWELLKTEDGTIYAGGHLTLEITSNTTRTINPPDTATGFFKLAAYGDIDLFKAGNGDLWIFADFGEAGRYDGSSWEFYNDSELPSFAFAPNGVLFEDEAGAIWKKAGSDNFVTFQNGNWAEGVPTHIPLTTTALSGDEGGQVAFHGDSLSVLSNDQLTFAGEFMVAEWVKSARNFVNDQDDNTWASISGSRLYNLTTNETLNLNLGDGNVGNFVFNPVSDDVLIWNYSLMNLYQDGAITATFDHDSAPFNGQGFRRAIYSENGTAWVEVTDGAIYVLQNNTWEFVYDFPAQTYIYLFQPGVGASIRVVTYSGGISFYDVSPSGLTAIENIPVSDIGFNGAYPGEAYDITWVQDLESNTIHRYNGTEWDQAIPFPVEWNVEGFIRHFTEVDGKILITGRHQIALYDGTEWFYYDVDNSPLDTESIDNSLLDKDGTVWLVHSFPNVIEKLTTSFISSTENVAFTKATPLLAYPNPATDFIRFEAESGSQFTLFSITGQVMNDGLVNANTTSVSLVDLPVGTYVLRVVGANGGVRVAKILKE